VLRLVSQYLSYFGQSRLIVFVGPNGPLPKEITEMFPSSPLVKRNGEVNAWDNSEFRSAVNATGKKQLIVAGITTDVSVVSLSVVQ
jgi:isochorismate hydrolase